MSGTRVRAGILLVVAGSLGLAASACGLRGSPTPGPNALNTAVAQTVQVVLTDAAATGAPQPQASDTPPPEPTETPPPTQTWPPEPSDTPVPSDTPAPTATDTATTAPTLAPTTAPATATAAPTPTAAAAAATTAATATTAAAPTAVQVPSPAPTQRPTIAPSPTCSQAIAPLFRSRLEANPDILIKLGCPMAPPRETWAAEQRFQYGGMLWQQDTDVIRMVYGNGMYQLVPDQWEEGDPEHACPEQGPAPEGLVMPKRGFGWHWCNTPGVRAGLGWALEAEQGYQLVWQTFEWGHVLHNRQGMLFVFHADGTWDIVD